MLLLVISSNFFYYSFANNEESLEISEFGINSTEQNEEMMVDNLDPSLSGLSKSHDNEIEEDIKDDPEINTILDTNGISSVFSEEIE
jgi:hypothetical protein